MYCHTYVNQFSCIFNELQLWSHISSDHPTFLKNVANLSKVNLPKATMETLDEINKVFSKLYNDIINLKKVVNNNPTQHRQHILAVKKIMDEFLRHDTFVLNFYPQLLRFGKENSAWQELVKHIISEQEFMLELITDLRQQIR
jgi:hypothetical protein